MSGNAKNRRLKFPDDLMEDIEDEPESFVEKLLEKSNLAWLCSIPAAMIVGSTGVLPLLIFNKGNCPEGRRLSEAISPAHLKILLSFSVGGLFGDVFLHLLPEAWMYVDPTDHSSGTMIGMWIIAGVICFLLIEKIFSIHEALNGEQDLTMEFNEELTSEEIKQAVGGSSSSSSTSVLTPPRGNGADSELIKRVKSDSDTATTTNVMNKKENATPPPLLKVSTATTDLDEQEKGKRIIGYLNLLANCIDNFTHGLAVSGSFVVSLPVGVCTTFAILLHEIPHEIGDFAILLQAGFNRWEAAKGQIITASGALFGCLFGLLAEGAGDASSWVLPFTSGGFIYIACVTILPDLVKERSLVESVKQMVALMTGIAVMGMVNVAH